MKKEKLGLNLYDLLWVVVLVLSTILGLKIGWVTEDCAPKLSLVGLILAVVCINCAKIYNLRRTFYKSKENEK